MYEICRLKKALDLNALVDFSKTPDGFMQYVNNKLPSKAWNVIKKILKESVSENGERNHITLKISVCLDYMDSIYKHKSYWGTQSSKTLDELLDNKQINTYNDAVSALPPAFYITDMKFVPDNSDLENDFDPEDSDSSWDGIGALYDNGGFTLSKMSSGERQMLYSLSYVLYHIKNIQSVKEDDNRVAYHNICLIFDEAELYFHPDYQRRFLGMLLEAISWCNIDKEIIHSIQILIVTHSPFVLTDMLTENTMYLRDGHYKE